MGLPLKYGFMEIEQIRNKSGFASFWYCRLECKRNGRKPSEWCTLSYLGPEVKEREVRRKLNTKKKLRKAETQRREVVKNFQSSLGAATSTTDHALSRYAFKT